MRGSIAMDGGIILLTEQKRHSRTMKQEALLDLIIEHITANTGSFIQQRPWRQGLCPFSQGIEGEICILTNE